MTVYLAIEMDDRTDSGYHSVFPDERSAVNYLCRDSHRARLRPSATITVSKDHGTNIVTVETPEWTLGYVRPQRVRGAA